MMTHKKSLAIILLTMLMGGVSYAQKGKVVSAALAYRHYMPSLMKKDFDGAKAALMEAKGYIDPAMENEETKDRAKANCYNAMINYSLMELASTGKFDSLSVYTSDSILTVIKTSAKKAHESNRWGGTLDDFFNKKISQAVRIGSLMFSKKHNYKMAFAGFAGAYKLKAISGAKEKSLTVSKQNAEASALRYIDTLQKSGQNEKALKFISEAMKVIPSSSTIATKGANIALGLNKLSKAEKYFQIVTKADPENKALFSSIGSIYLTQANKVKQKLDSLKPQDPKYKATEEKMNGLYKKATTNLNHALEIDSTYADAAYNLGVLYLNRGENLKTKASQMNFDNPNYTPTMNRSKNMYKKAIHPLVLYIHTDPDNAAVLTVLFQVYRNVGNTEKALEYRKRAEAAKAKKKQ